MAPIVPKAIEVRFAQRRQKSQVFTQQNYITGDKVISEEKPPIKILKSKKPILSKQNSNSKIEKFEFAGEPRYSKEKSRFLRKQKSAGILYQPESINRNWMLKRGKAQMVYYDQEQGKLL